MTDSEATLEKLIGVLQLTILQLQEKVSRLEKAMNTPAPSKVESKTTSVAPLSAGEALIRLIKKGKWPTERTLAELAGESE